MNHSKFRQSGVQRRRSKRFGAVAVEFAVVAPMLLAITLGLVELSRVFDIQNTMETAAREGARFASMDRTGMLEEGASANDKMIQDVENFLSSSGIPLSDDVQVTVSPYGNPDQPFDLDDPANDLELFQVQIKVPFSDVSLLPMSEANDYILSATVVFRNGRATLSQ